MIDRKRLALNALLALGFSGAGHAGVLFNSNGTGTAGAFDWAQTSFVAVGGNTAVNNFQNGCAASCEFTVYTQARLNGTNSQANVSNTPGGGPDFVAQTGYNSTLRPGVTPPPFPTPEPASLALLGLGAGLLGIFNSRRRSWG
jgi:hypothetical protein